MLLAIDIGNTQTVFGMFESEVGNVGGGDGNSSGKNRPDLSYHWRVATVAERTADELALLISELLGLEGLDAASDVTGMAASSTVPRLTAAMREMCARWYDVHAVILEPGVRTGMSILYDDPREVGADRIANAVGALDAYGGPTIVVDFGTATTFDCISDSGAYLGGAIVPGVEISMDALFAQAAALRRVELIEPKRIIGKNTVESIQSGAVFGFAAQAEGLCGKLQEEMGESNIVLTGGLADIISPYLKVAHVRDPWLTLHGLRIIFERNSSQ
jgi:type III pantothenate kinase